MRLSELLDNKEESHGHLLVVVVVLLLSSDNDAGHPRTRRSGVRA